MLTLDDRMKRYEHAHRNNLMRRMPVIIRIDGKAFHTFTRGVKKPFDRIVMQAMIDTTKYLCKNIQGCKIGYTQSDEISLLLTDYEKLETEAWFGYNIQKVVSIAASMATLAFNSSFEKQVKTLGNLLTDESRVEYHDRLMSKVNTALFDARVFILPKDEVCNYFVWRQQDAIRNSIQALGQSQFSANDLHFLNTNQIIDKLIDERDMSWHDCSSHEKHGIVVSKQASYLDDGTMRKNWLSVYTTPIFKENRDVINDLI